MTSILRRITELRNRRGWSEYQLAEYSGVPQSTISSWYQKSYTPSIASLEKICSAFHISLSQFFAESGSESIPLTSQQLHLLEKWETLSESSKEALLLLLSNF